MWHLTCHRIVENSLHICVSFSHVCNLLTFDTVFFKCGGFVGWLVFFMLIFIALVDTGEKFVRKKVHSLSGRWLVPVPLAGTGACGKPKLLTSVPEEPGQPGPCDLTV